MLGVSSDQSIADMVSGNGYFTLPVAELVGDAPVYAIDVEEGLLEELSATAESRDLSTITCIHDDAWNLAAVLPERVDVILIANTFHGVEDKDAFVKQVSESLRPGGQCLIVNWHDLPKAELQTQGSR